MKLPNYGELPRAPYCSLLEPQCRKCASFAVTVRSDNVDVVLVCKDCLFAVVSPNAELAYLRFHRPETPDRTLDYSYGES